MNQNLWENKPDNLNAKEILDSHPDFKKRAKEKSAVLGYSKKMYALGIFDLYKDGPYKGYACAPGDNIKVNFWQDYIKSIGSDFAIRQLDLNVEGTIDKYTGGRDETNYNFDRDHYVLYETKILKNLGESNGQLHIDNADSMYLYETGKRNIGKSNINDPEYGQVEDLIESTRLPQGSITERYYLKHSRECPPEVFIEACKQIDGLNKELSKMDTSDLRKAVNFFSSHSYMNFTAAADFVDKEKYDYVHLPNGHIVIFNKDVLLDPEKIAEKELSQSENARVEQMYEKYITQDISNIRRGSEEDLKQFEKFLQSL